MPCLPLPLHQILPFPQPLQKDNNPLPHTMSLPPLLKVRCCRPKKFGRLPEGLLPIRTINEIFRTIPSTKLASLVKGEVLSPEKIRATTGGIAIPPFASHYHSRFSSGEGLCVLVWLRICIIPPTFRRARVCVCLYSFVFALSPSLFVGEELVSRVTWFTLCASTWFTCYQ